MFKRTLIALCVLALAVAACAPASKATDQYGGRQLLPGQPQVAPAAPAATMAPAAAPAISESASAFDAAGNAIPPAERLVIQNADLTIVVDEPPTAMEAISRMATDMGGFVVTSNQYKTTTGNGVEVTQGQITIRVPAEKLDDALAKIKGLTKNPEEDVRSENRSGQDVTKEYTDLQSRLRNYEDTEKQLREIMASATKTEDVMNVFNQLTQVREQIEIIKGQMKYYEESAALSAINIQVMAQEAVAPLTIGTWKPAGVARDAIQTLIDTLKFLANLLIWVALYVLPVILLVGLPIWLVVALVRRNRRRKAAPPAAKPE